MRTTARKRNGSSGTERVRCTLLGLAGLSITWLAVPALAQETVIGAYQPPGPEATTKGIPYGPLTVYPSVALDYYYDDNIYRTPHDQQGSSVLVLTPGVRVEYLDGPNAYALQYQGFKSWYSNDSNNNYWNHDVLGTAALQLSARSDLLVRGEYLDWADPRGTDYPVGTVRGVVVNEVGRETSLASTHPDLWNSYRIGGLYGYGANGAKGRIELLAEQWFRRYTNNDQEARDRNTTNLGATFYYRTTPDLQLLAGFLNSNINYVNQPQDVTAAGLTRDSTERFYNAGARWDVTAKTTGQVRLGYLTKDFESSDRSNFGNFAWELIGTYRPRTYSIVTLASGLVTYEPTTAVDNYIETKYVDGTWTHAWQPRFSTNLGLGFAQDNYNPTPRADDRWYGGISASYQFRPWLQVGAGYHHGERSSNAPGQDFNDNIYSLFLQASM